MILINLLPHRAEKRKRRKTAFFVGLALSVVVGGLLVGAGMLLLQQMTDQQIARNEYLRRENALLDEQIKDIANLKAEIEGLKSRQQAVEDLQTGRNVPVHLLTELVRQVPEGIFLTRIQQTDKLVTVSGLAQTQDRVSEFIRNTSRSSEWLYNPDLNEIRLGGMASTKDQKRLFEFTMRVSIKAPQTEASAKGQPSRKP
ncbi:PilN domain-containing protein [Pelomonas sp. APW6]|uniref:PilN domain-containing protein n=1 Tax=Roseateles subflavus TaxID=3053353 RepID=A0ABT7LK76_9BURK|nr:PilN domain-containing protein [Pelomonas sp. APW6]MDL5032667.1 PilN domain-containing protein [Pelomonas sp. APW6]